jgi:hypothetical protein
MADKVVVQDDGDLFRLVWVFDRDGCDTGARLGESLYTEADIDGEKNKGDRLHIALTLVLQKSLEDTGGARDKDSFFWETRAAAASALKMAKTQAEALLAGRSWPEWAVKAKAEGWTPPKGWKP